MIISASRRTDVPAFYSDWFLNRLKERYVLVRNPMNAHQVSRIDLSPDVVDGIVFWTKNPKPMLNRLEALGAYNYYFQFTLNAYKTNLEGNVPSKSLELIETFKRLSEKIGKEKVIWRYDPILVNTEYTKEHHLHYFDQLANVLHGYTDQCVFSFVDEYAKIKNKLKQIKQIELDLEERNQMAKALAEISRKYDFTLKTCAESAPYTSYGIEASSCIDPNLLAKISGHHLKLDKDKNQRLECKCATSIDIGAYNTCKHNCLYCYANGSTVQLIKNLENYDVSSPMLCSTLREGDQVYIRAVKSNRVVTGV